MIGQRGMSYLESMVILVVVGCMAAIGTGAMGRILEQASARSVATVFLSLVNQCRTEAVIRHTYLGIAFVDTPTGVEAKVYKDGDLDGLSAADIAQGIDTPVGSRHLLQEVQAVVGLPDAVRTDPEGGTLDGDGGVRFGRSRLLSFSPRGTATPGSLYLRCGREEAWAFRVSGLGARVRVFRWRHGIWTPIETR